jgi:hypothetical protein
LRRTAGNREVSEKTDLRQNKWFFSDVRLTKGSNSSLETPERAKEFSPPASPEGHPSKSETQIDGPNFLFPSPIPWRFLCLSPAPGEANSANGTVHRVVECCGI